MERLTYCNFLHSENVENGVLLDCLQFSRRLLNVTYLSHTMCHVLKATFDTIYGKMNRVPAGFKASNGSQRVKYLHPVSILIETRVLVTKKCLKMSIF